MESNPIAQAIKKLLASQEERLKLNRDKWLARENYEAVGELEIHIETLKYLIHSIGGDSVNPEQPKANHREKIDEYIASIIEGNKKPETKTQKQVQSHSVKLGDVIKLSDSKIGMNKSLRFSSKEFNDNNDRGLAYYFEELD